MYEVSVPSRPPCPVIAQHGGVSADFCNKAISNSDQQCIPTFEPINISCGLAGFRICHLLGAHYMTKPTVCLMDRMSFFPVFSDICICKAVNVDWSSQLAYCDRCLELLMIRCEAYVPSSKLLNPHECLIYRPLDKTGGHCVFKCVDMRNHQRSGAVNADAKCLRPKPSSHKMNSRPQFCL